MTSRCSLSPLVVAKLLIDIHLLTVTGHAARAACVVAASDARIGRLPLLEHVFGAMVDDGVVLG